MRENKNTAKGLEAINRELSSTEVHVWRICLDQPADNMDRLVGYLSPDELDRLQRLRFTTDRERYLVGRGALREILAAYLGACPGELSFVYGMQGKPALMDNLLSFNLAHSQHLGLLAITTDCPLGVDLEEIRPNKVNELVAHKYFPLRDALRLLALPEAEQDAAFFVGWVRREAYLKARGRGFSLSQDGLNVSFNQADRAAGWNILDEAGRCWYLTDLDVAPGFAGALVTQKEVRRIRYLAWPGDETCA